MGKAARECDCCMTNVGIRYYAIYIYIYIYKFVCVCVWFAKLT